MLIKDVARNECIGCGLCYSVCQFDAIEMTTDELGFLPEIDDSMCTECGECAEVCPGINILDYPANFGDIKECLICSAKEKHTKHSASSGGAARTVLRSALENKIVDKVIITRTTDDPYRPETIITDNLADLESDRLNSIYSPTSPLSALKNLDSRLKYAFVGLPCHIAGIELCDDIKKLIHLKIGLFCHQTPSYKFLNKLTSDVSENKEVDRFRFRGDGWPGKSVIYYKNGSKTELNFHEMWIKYNWNRDYQMGRCSICSYYTAEFADLSIGDPWSYMGKDQDGLSLILVRTDRGKAAVKTAESLLNIEELDSYDEVMEVHGANYQYKYENKAKKK